MDSYKTASYLTLLRTPRALRTFVPALIGRLSFSMVTLVLLLSIHQHSSSFALAGTATGVFGLANVLASPYRARLVDRWGQRFTLNLLAAGYGLGLSAMAILISTSVASAWSIIIIALFIGISTPPLGAAMRVLWSTIAESAPLRARAYSLDAVAEELLFTTGPLIATAVVVSVSPAAGLLATAILGAVGSIGMTIGAVARLPKRSMVHSIKRDLRPLRQRGFLPVLTALVGAGMILGVIEVSAPAFAQDQGSPALAGILLAAFAAGSAVGGLSYGRKDWKSPLANRLLVLGACMALSCGMLLLTSDAVILASGLAITGFFLAPSLVTGYLLADQLTTAGVRTEASSWINTAVNLGAALATGVAGFVIDKWSTDTAFATGALAAFVCLALAAPPLLWQERSVQENQP
jgi:MFS family permease